MRAGLMRNRVTVEGLTVTQSTSSGEELETWATVATEWMQVEPMAGSEFFRSDATMERQPVMFKRRHRSGLMLDEKTHRLVWRGETYDVESVSDTGGRERMDEIVGVRRA